MKARSAARPSIGASCAGGAVNAPSRRGVQLLTWKRREGGAGTILQGYPRFARAARKASCFPPRPYTRGAGPYGAGP